MFKRFTDSLKRFSAFALGCIVLILVAIVLVILGAVFNLTALYFLGVVASSGSVSLGILSLRE